MSICHTFLCLSLRTGKVFCDVRCRVVATFNEMQGNHPDKRGHKGASRGAGNILYLDPDGSYMGIYISKDLFVCTLKICVLYCVLFFKEQEAKRLKTDNFCSNFSKFAQAILTLQTNMVIDKYHRPSHFFLIDRLYFGKQSQVYRKIEQKVQR